MKLKDAWPKLEQIHEDVDEVYYGLKERYEEDEIPLIFALHDCVHNIHEALEKYKKDEKLKEVV